MSTEHAAGRASSSPSAGYRIQRFATASEFLTATRAFLLEREVVHNLILGLAADVSRPQTVYRPPFYLGGVLDEQGRVCGCALRTPPFKLLLTELPRGAVDALVADVASWHSATTGVSGVEDTARHFAERWCEVAGGSWRIGLRQRLYTLETLHPPERPAAGAPVVAGPADTPFVASWLEEFGRDAGVPVANPTARARAMCETGDAVLWVDGGATVSMAAVTARTPRGARVGFVYTPPELRGRGYASVCVAELSRRLLASGVGFCCLFTDLANPVSNAIYQRLGYQPVRDFVECVFEG